ncbi:hypothetical protein SAMN05421788_104144 [Filimonas lacunae]|uniref:YD repeat-containing protein n=1 Tax=Filimonas lacunae TaxID=477680 RepID=A0A173M9D1_9BACT|nr:hypothetical protein [Filimonas lacunae]BAV04121.1 hypothetical protein FLA_0100 [Filimonas lacunae]SIT15255.1 hypothetical protein SAMN05421788_104144 [Filimonas lacunae]
MKKVLIPALALLVAAVSCKKDDAPVNTETGKYLSRIAPPDDYVYLFNYAGGKFQSLADSSNSGIEKDSAIYKNGILSDIYYVSSDAEVTPNYNFVYDANNRLVRVNYTYPSSVEQFDSLTYTSAGKLAFIYSANIQEDGSRFIYRAQEITIDANGNITTVLNKETAGLSSPELLEKSKHVYTYDTKTSPFARVASPAYWMTINGNEFFGTNNVTKTEQYGYSNGAYTLDKLEKFTYTYDADGDVITSERSYGTSEANLTSEGVTKYYYTIL